MKLSHLIKSQTKSKIAGFEDSSSTIPHTTLNKWSKLAKDLEKRLSKYENNKEELDF
jgi:hypothetical protein